MTESPILAVMRTFLVSWVVENQPLRQADLRSMDAQLATTVWIDLRIRPSRGARARGVALYDRSAR